MDTWQYMYEIGYSLIAIEKFRGLPKWEPEFGVVTYLERHLQGNPCTFQYNQILHKNVLNHLYFINTFPNILQTARKINIVYW